MKTLTASRTLFTLAGVFLFALLWLIASALPASASGVWLEDGTGSGTKPPTTGTGGSKKPAKKPPAGSGAPVDPYLVVETSTYGPTLATCPTSKGRQAKGAWLYYHWEFEKTNDRTIPPEGIGWQWAGSFSNGHHWKRLMYTGKKVCAYPALKAYATVECVIRHYVAIDMVQPQAKRVAVKSAPAGFTAGSSNYTACFNSGGDVGLGGHFKEYGYYRTSTWRQAQNVRVEYTIEKDTWTGAWPASKIVGWGPVRTTQAKVGMTASLHCTGPNKPGIFHKDWTEAPCQNTTGTPKKGQWMCVREPVRVDVAGPDASYLQMKTVASGSPLQLGNDGKPRLLQFQQKVVGGSITINKESSFVTRSGTPWDPMLSEDKNVLELRSSAFGSSLMKNATTTKTWNKNQGNVYVKGMAASNPGSKTTLIHHLDWTGIREIQTVEITSVNAETGAINTRNRTITVPTSGTCKQSVGLEFGRVIGDAR